MRQSRESRLVERFRRAATWFGAAITLGLIIVLLRGGAEYGTWQDLYADELAFSRTDSTADGLPGDIPRGVYELRLDDVDRIDRCISCHCALDDPRMAEASQPLRAHPGAWLNTHPAEEFGCTLCHGGQGRALDMRNAHARTAEVRWPRPLLPGKYLQSACAGCHLALFSASPDLDSARILSRGRAVFAREGCLGCHRVRGVGGSLGPDLTEQGNKTRHEYDYRRIAGEQSIPNWLREHFVDPEAVSPGSDMLALDLPEHDLDALVTLTMGLVRPGLPYVLMTLEVLREFKGDRVTLTGAQAEGLFCSACHGAQGEGKSYESYRVGVPSVGNTSFLRVASSEYLLFTIRYGRGRRQMSAWLPRFSGLRTAELDSLVKHLESRLELRSTFSRVMAAAGSAERGERRFARDCAMCHGERGGGGVALPLNRPAVLAGMTPVYLYETLLRGRGNTAMPSWRDLDDVGIADLFALFRSWGGFPGTVLAADLPPGREKEGAIRFTYLCSRCHGLAGEGGTGPAIINRDFLAAADNAFISAMIARGRPHTPMFGWTDDVPASDRLDRQGIADIISFIRGSAAREPQYIHAGATRGRAAEGAQLFARHCSECHGKNAEGVQAPALNNQEFLSAASNGYILGTISLGREGTKMPTWGRPGNDRPMLTGQQREDIVAWLRSLQYAKLRFPAPEE
jgi:mono/diheme cytochrome c family protein